MIGNQKAQNIIGLYPLIAAPTEVGDGLNLKIN